MLTVDSLNLKSKNRYVHLDEDGYSVYFTHGQLISRNRLKIKSCRMTENFYKDLCSVDNKAWKKEDVYINVSSPRHIWSINHKNFDLQQDNIISTKKVVKITFSNKDSLLMFLLQLDSK
jgi:hypothetical protein